MLVQHWSSRPPDCRGSHIFSIDLHAVQRTKGLAAASRLFIYLALSAALLAALTGFLTLLAGLLVWLLTLLTWFIVGHRNLHGEISL